MSSRRDLKKTINNSFEYLYEDYVFYILTKKNPDFIKLEDLFQNMSQARLDLLSRISISEGKEVKNRTKIYYKKLKDDLRKQVDTFGKRLQALD